jgi:hypothetical protein
MYWFRTPLGSISYPSGFRSALRPALENRHISEIRFIIDCSTMTTHLAWHKLVFPLLQDWARQGKHAAELQIDPDRGRFCAPASGLPALSWILTDLSGEPSPSFKLFVDDGDGKRPRLGAAEIFLSMKTRSVRMLDGSQQIVRVPDTILRTNASSDHSLFDSLARIVSRWDFLFD